MRRYGTVRRTIAFDLEEAGVGAARSDVCLVTPGTGTRIR